MTYEGRTIWARGLTNYMRGYTLRFSDFDGLYHQVIIDNVSYDEVTKQTIVYAMKEPMTLDNFDDPSLFQWHELPHEQPVIIHG